MLYTFIIITGISFNLTLMHSECTSRQKIGKLCITTSIYYFEVEVLTYYYHYY